MSKKDVCCCCTPSWGLPPPCSLSCVLGLVRVGAVSPSSLSCLGSCLCLSLLVFLFFPLALPSGSLSSLLLFPFLFGWFSFSTSLLLGLLPFSFLLSLPLVFSPCWRLVVSFMASSPSGCRLLAFGCLVGFAVLPLCLLGCCLASLLGFLPSPCWCGSPSSFVWGLSHGFSFSLWCFFFLSCCGGCFFRPLVSFVLVCVRCVCLWCFLRVSCPWCCSCSWSSLVASLGCGS
jgi:hypothetical protein